MREFLQCGLFGLGLEILWTGLHSLLRGDPHLTGHSSLWMFPIYGLAIVIRPAYQILQPLPFFFRGLIYMIGIFAVEYLTGTLLRSQNLCPWNYSSTPLNINGLIRLDYAPLWFFVGLLFEWLLRSR